MSSRTHRTTTTATFPSGSRSRSSLDGGHWRGVEDRDNGPGERAGPQRAAQQSTGETQSTTGHCAARTAPKSLNPVAGRARSEISADLKWSPARPGKEKSVAMDPGPRRSKGENGLPHTAWPDGQQWNEVQRGCLVQRLLFPSCAVPNHQRSEFRKASVIAPEHEGRKDTPRSRELMELCASSL
ncbi:hypothetical protein Mp_2g21380 [Marchantia polymorpha subsp. ruderalis]|uniref:Uncharacterized protein n=1 Tax=Marchantia polymorpha TaxID=3197 RepID=A0A2R6X2R4_MARPO|nr:hypothetical protein MARPO_0040s0076 [Marchantia polymorpha]BBN03174.1 hypothetical protein Mp_2g21380 [Marchantia polymorpha subsp. ruderalis]|eukprot:PTQ40403.1 hypothetical protein MARPO_0040s0076 [Marchantia polymorpha]